MGPIIELFSQIAWKEIVGVISAIAFLLAALAALLAVLRVGKIVEALREFQRSKSELAGLLDAIDRLESMTPRLNMLATDIQEDILELKAAPDPETPKTVVAEGKKPPTPVAESKWPEIISTWRDTRNRLEAIIEELDGRTKRRYYNRYGHNYSDIINMLLADGKLSQPAAEAAIEMNKFLLSWKPKPDKSAITEDEMQKFRAWKKAFDSANAPEGS